MKNAMQGFFERLDCLYRNSLGTCPTVSWDPEMDQSLFVSGPDEDGEAQWKPALGHPMRQIGNQSLCPELAMLFGGWYYWQLRGRYMGMQLDFAPVCSNHAAVQVAKAALADGNYYFPGENCALLAACSMDGNDDLLLFYCQDTGRLFVYDQDKRRVMNMACSLPQLVERMEAIL